MKFLFFWRRRKPTLFHKMLALHIANTGDHGALR